MILIPKPCHEDWNRMSPAEQGRHCAVCSKVVVDFSTKTEEEIAAYFLANAGKKTCGNFRASQVAAPVPAAIVDTNRKKAARVFLAAVLYVFGGLLFSSFAFTSNDSAGKSSVHNLDSPQQELMMRGKVKYEPPRDTAKINTPHEKNMQVNKCSLDTAKSVQPVPEKMLKGDVIYIEPGKDANGNPKQ